MSFQERIAVITGAAVGIGRAVAVKLAAEGARVAALDLNAEGLESLRQEVSSAGGVLHPFLCDVSKEEEVNRVFSQIKETLGKVDILVNNAALWRCHSTFLDTPVADWERFFDVNVMGVVYCTRAALPAMLQSGYGRIVNVASVAGVYGNAKMVHYSATKGAILSMTKALAKEVAEHGVTVNSVSPGTVTSSEENDLTLTAPSEVNYMKRTGSDMENAELICFLASDKAAYISGQNVQIDGCRKKI